MARARRPLEGAVSLRWSQVDGDGPQGELFEETRREVGQGEYRGMEFLTVHARSLINELTGDPGLPFRYTINPYRGCSHACTYCFARPTHAYLGLGPGVDFDQRIVVKVNAVERLQAELHPSRWAGHHIALGTNTDPYQRCEAKFRLTRGIVATLAEHANPFSILTKSTLVRRDLDILADAARRTDVRANLSIGTLDDDVWRVTEPGTPHPRRRLEAVAELNAAGVRCGVLIAPIIPGLSDDAEQLEAVARACVEAGAVSVSTVVLHLRPGVKEHFLGELARTHPGLLDRYRRLYPGANAPKAEQRRVADIVHGAVGAAGGLAVDRLDPGHMTGRTAPPAPVTIRRPPAGGEQLGLAL